MRCRPAILSFLLVCSLPVVASARVTRVTSSGFLITHEADVAAPPFKVFDSLVRQVGSWWNPEHTWSGSAKNLSIDAHAGGCFCEKLANGGGVEHMRIVFVAPDEMIRMTGALGPLQSSGIAGSLTWAITKTTSGSKVILTYSVGGFMDGGFEQIAPAADGMLGEQFGRLKMFVETGSPTASPSPHH
jgi:uncharacterized protein YndB with AHSA1/START domain